MRVWCIQCVWWFYLKLTNWTDKMTIKQIPLVHHFIQSMLLSEVNMWKSFTSDTKNISIPGIYFPSTAVHYTVICPLLLYISNSPKGPYRWSLVLIVLFGGCHFSRILLLKQMWICFFCNSTSLELNTISSVETHRHRHDTQEMVLTGTGAS